MAPAPKRSPSRSRSKASTALLPSPTVHSGRAIAVAGRRVVGFAVLAAGAVCALVLIGAATSFAAAPVTTAQVVPTPGPSGWHQTNAPVTITLNAADTGTGVSSIRYRWTLDGGVPGNWVTVNNAQAVVSNPTNSPGVHLLEFYATDGGSLEEAVKSLQLKRDFTAPILRPLSMPMVPSSVGGAWLPGVQFTTSAIDAPGTDVWVTTSGVDEDSIEHRLTGSSTWLPGDSPITFNSIGTYTIEGRASDVAGNTVTGNMPPIVVENVTPNLRLAMRNSGRRQVKGRKRVVYKVNVRNNYTAPMNLQTRICTTARASRFADVQTRVRNTANTGWRWANTRCDTNFSLPTGTNWEPRFRVRPTRAAAKRVRSGRNVRVKVQFRTTVPGLGSRTQAITLRVR